MLQISREEFEEIKKEIAALKERLNENEARWDRFREGLKRIQFYGGTGNPAYIHRGRVTGP